MNKSIMQRQATALAGPVGSLDAYIHAAYSLPILSAEEEAELAENLRAREDLDAARKLIAHNLRFVVQVARGYTGYGLGLSDLIQEGNIGLMKAVKRFDPSLKVRLVSFAVHWIRAEIHEYILRNWRIVKVATTKAQRKLFFNLRSAKKRLGWLNYNEVETVANDLGVNPKEVMEMESRLAGQDIGFDYSPDEGDNSLAPVGYLQDMSADPAEAAEHLDWSEHQTECLHSALSSLNARSRDILQRRWLTESKATLNELADEYQVSAERIRQLEKNAIHKLKGLIAE